MTPDTLLFTSEFQRQIAEGREATPWPKSEWIERNESDRRVRNARFERLAIAMMTDEQAEQSWERFRKFNVISHPNSKEQSCPTQ